MDVLGIVLSLFLLMFMAYMGFSVILFAPVFALLAAALQGLPVMPSYTELFHGQSRGLRETPFSRYFCWARCLER